MGFFSNLFGRKPTTKCFTGKLVSPATLFTSWPPVLLADASYAEVNSAWLASHYEAFRSDLFNKGVVKWDARFDCNRFALLYRAFAQTTFFLATFHDTIQAQALAIGEVWYRPAWGGGGVHAINVAITDIGVMYIEPQTGNVLNLSPTELASILHRQF